MMHRSPLFPTILVLISAVSALRAHDPATEMAEAAKVWLASLDDAQKAKAVHTMDHAERETWHFIPKPFEGEGMRGGLTVKDMRPDQRHLAFALLSTGLSHHGLTTALEIMSLEQVLHELENNAPKRDTLMYYVSIFGEPGGKSWSWTFEGHHLSMNFTIAEGKIVSATPNFFASNPAEVREGPRAGLRVLASEEDVARSLVQSLDEAQKKKAVVAAEAPEDILSAAETKIDPFENAGIPFGELNADQQKALQTLIKVYVERAREEFSDAELAQIEQAGHDKIVFAWLGGTEKNQPHYYRVQGPTFLLEYANTQNGANHVHAVWRDFKGDFGRDVLREHYQAFHRAE